MNWDKRIERAEKNGYFTNNDKYASGSWKRCSIGERFKITSINDARLTVKGKLVTLGVRFCEHVCKNRIAQAKRLHNRIKKMASV